MYQYEYPRPAVTATIVPFYKERGVLKVLLGKRCSTTRAYPGYISLPGGFMDASKADDTPCVVTSTDGERVEDTAVRELHEEMNIKLMPGRLHLFNVYSRPDTDPRCHVVNVCYWVYLTEEEVENAKAGDDIEELIFTDAGYLTLKEFDFAFNHALILKDAINSINRETYR